MKLHNTIKTTALAGFAAAMLPFSANAALTFDSWAVTTGTIAYTCPAGITCTTLVSGDGFLQQQYTDSGSGTVYIQTIVTEAGATGTGGSAGVNYSDESFIQTGGSTSGIAGKQTMADTAFNFTGSSQLYTGWATSEPGAAAGNLQIAQGFTDAGTAVAGDEFTSSFGLNINLDTAGNQTGKTMSISQVAWMGDGATANTTDVQSFVIEQRQGDLLASANSQLNGFQLGNTSFDSAGTPLPSPVTWVAGDNVMVVWLGQRVSDGSAGGGLSTFGYESVTASTTATLPGTPTATTFSTSTTDPVVDNTVTTASPFNWDSATTSGAAPVLP